MQNYLRDIRFDSKNHNLNLLTFICAEDISSAFESIAHKIIELYSELTFESPDFNMPLLARSYLDRQSFITDREGSEMLEVFRTFADQTSPQGSSNSPCWWRVYDGGFSAIFKKFLQKIKLENGSKIHDIFHVSYADDHLIAITLDLGSFKNDEEVQKTIIELSTCVRQDLIKSTQIFGCRIAPDKSEILAPAPLKSDPKNKEIKPKIVDEFTWLGYSLGIQENYLVFTPKRMRSRFKTVYEKFHSMCQYIQSINVKRKIYEVYVSPVVDWFIPTILTGKWHALTSRKNEVEIFQQKCLAVVVGVCKNVCRTELNKVCGFYSVFDNCTRVAMRTTKFYERDISYLKGEGENLVLGGMSLRSGTITENRVWINCDHFDLGDRIHFIANTRTTIQPPKFSSVEAKRWSVVKNTNIRLIINLRNGVPVSTSST